jgi:hypothetical protein
MLLLWIQCNHSARMRLAGAAAHAAEAHAEAAEPAPCCDTESAVLRAARRRRHELPDSNGDNVP